MISKSQCKQIELQLYHNEMNSSMSLIRSITIQRVETAPGLCDPIQWSDNQQLAINNGLLISVLDPKMPSLEYGKVKSGDFSLLDPKSIFLVTSILHSEVLDLLPIRKFNKMTMISLDEPFCFRNIHDPTIISHQWTPTGPNNRDSYLGVLFNTGELLILCRENLLIEKYSVETVMFDILADEFGVSIGESETQFEKSQFLSMKIKSFSFSLIDTGLESILLLNVVTSNGVLLVYNLLQKKKLELNILVKVETDLEPVKQKWSPWFQISDTSFISYLSVINADNSISMFKLNYNTSNGTLSISTPTQVSKKSRFLSCHCDWLRTKQGIYFLHTRTGILSVIFLSDEDNNIQTYSQKLETISEVVGIAKILEGNLIRVIVGFDSGKFESFIFNTETKTFESCQIQKLTSFVKNSLYSFQLTSNSADDGGDEDGPVKLEDDGLNVETSLGLSVEGSFVNCGFKLGENGIVSIVYKIVPKNVLYYQIASKTEIQVAFIQLTDPQITQKHSTSLAQLNSIWLTKFDELPVYSDNRLIQNGTLNDHTSHLTHFFSEIEEFKKDNFIHFDQVNLNIDQNDILQNFVLTLVKNFNTNTTIRSLQVMYNFDIILSDCIQGFGTGLNDEESSMLSTYKKSIQEEMQLIDKLIVLHLSKLILLYVLQYHISLTLENDKYLIIKLYQTMRQLEPASSGIFESIVPQKAEITIRTKFFEELFRVGANDIASEENSLETSDTNHKWTKCKLSHFPLLQLNNRKDEMKKFNYIIYDSTLMGPSTLVTEMLDNIKFCYITGNKVYDLN